MKEEKKVILDISHCGPRTGDAIIRVLEGSNEKI